MEGYRFEKLDVWILARTFVSFVYESTEQMPAQEKFGLTNQIRRAAVSIVLNIVEGSDRKSDKEFVRFLRIGYTSLQEVVAGYYIALDRRYVDQKTFDQIYKESHIVGKKINALIKYLNK